MNKENQPLQMTFIADPPADMSVRLINVLVRQIEISEKNKVDVIAACKYIVDTYNRTPTNV